MPFPVTPDAHTPVTFISWPLSAGLRSESWLILRVGCY